MNPLYSKKTRNKKANPHRRRTRKKESYQNSMTDEWLNDLQTIRTDWRKPLLKIALYLRIVFIRRYELEIKNHKHQNYYVTVVVVLPAAYYLLQFVM